jgi:antitoxin (DNA-binding transcriptional repressor) of toxin-antitoxin stability system
MAKKDKPWWANGDTLWGGEAFQITEDSTSLGVKKGDVFRIEKKGNAAARLIPHPKNAGKWKNGHSKNKPIILKAHDTTKNERAFSMQVKLSSNGAPKTFFLVERKNGTLAIKRNPPDTPEQNGDTASIRR